MLSPPLATHQKIIGDCSHAFMRQNNPNDHNVTDHRHRNDAAVGGGPECDLPHRLDELVEAVAAVDGPAGPAGPVTVGGVVERVHVLGIGQSGSWVLKIDQCPVTGMNSALRSRRSSAYKNATGAPRPFYARRKRVPEDTVAPKRTTQLTTEAPQAV